MLRGIFAALALALALAAPAFAGPAGVWMEKDGGTIRVFSCGRGYCATIATVKPRLDPETGKPRTDKNNADASRRRRPLVGIRVLTATQPDGAGKWSGTLYDLDRGQTFSGSLVELGPRSIRIEGCALGLCGGEELRRVR
jgi:uncharacterized protein (DUF2147 family)